MNTPTTPSNAPAAANAPAPTRPGALRLAVETLLAACGGLLPEMLHAIGSRASMTEGSPHLVTRTTYTIATLTSPGDLVGMVVGGCLDIGGFTTNWRWLDRIEQHVGLGANVVLFAIVWNILRTLPRTSLPGRFTIAMCLVWLAFALLGAIIGNFFMVL